MGDLLDKLAIIFVKWRIRKGWGSCEGTPDIEDFSFEDKTLNAKGRCGSCQADEVTEWLRNWEQLLK